MKQIHCYVLNIKIAPKQVWLLFICGTYVARTQWHYYSSDCFEYPSKILS